MRVLVTGAYGLIGSAILARLHREGHEVAGTGRSIAEARRRFPYARWIAADFDKLTTVEAWQPLLGGIDAVVNCAGALQDGPRDDLRRVHVDAPLALFAACERSGPRRLIQISAAGAGMDRRTAFSATKGEADARLAASGLDWLILQPGIVLSHGVYGATAMLRGLAAVPWRTPVAAGDARLQIVSVEDVAQTVAWGLGPGLHVRATFELVHPQVLSVRDVVVAQRQWLGFAQQPVVDLPRPIVSLVSRLADLLGTLGWRSPARSTAFSQLADGIHGDPAGWIAATGIHPMGLADILEARPSTVQDRWFARLYALKPVAIATLALYWMATGLVSLGPGWDEGVSLLSTPNFPASFTKLTIILGALLDITLGALLLVRPLTRPVLIVMFVVCIPYLAAATWIDPALWLDPLGRMTKTIPVMLAILFTLAVLDER